MAVRVEKKQGVWTIIHSRPESRNAMDPSSADLLTEAFLEFGDVVFIPTPIETVLGFYEV